MVFGRQVLHQPVELGSGGEGGGGVVGIAEVDQAAARLVRFFRQLAYVGRIVLPQLGEHHRPAQGASQLDGPFVGRRHADQRARGRREHVHARVQHFARPAPDDDLLRREVLAPRDGGVDLAELLVVIAARRRQHLPHRRDGNLGRTGGVLVGVEPRHVLGKVRHVEGGALRESHLGKQSRHYRGTAAVDRKGSTCDCASPPSDGTIIALHSTHAALPRPQLPPGAGAGRAAAAL